jgi:hypothetical protein
MATVSIVKIKIRRGTDTERRQVILDIGELGYTTDTDSRRLFIGDGSSLGGNPAGMKFYVGDFTPANALPLRTAQVGDIIFNPVDTKLYCLTGLDSSFFPNYNEPSAYQFIGTRTDDNSIEYNSSGKIRVKDQGISAVKLNSDVVLPSEGLSKPSGGAIRVKYDSTSITVNGSGQLSVIQNGIKLGSIDSVSQSLNASSLKLVSYRTSPGIVGTDTGLLWVDGSGYVRMTT